MNNWDKIIKLADYIALAFTFVFICFFYVLCEDVAINFPLGDDVYQSTLWMHSFYHAPTTTAQLKHYFFQFNSHFLLVHYFSMIMDYHIFGYVSYKHLIIFGNLLLLLIWGLLFYFFKQENKPNFLLFLPVTLVLFTPADQMINWAGTAIHCSAMILFGLLSLWAFTKQTTKWTIIAVINMFICMFSLVGGLAVPIAGAIMFTILPNKNYKQLGIWVIGSLLCYGLFFYMWISIVAGKHEIDYWEAFLVFFSFLGSGASIHKYFTIMAPLAGIISSLFLFYVYFKTDYFSRNPVIFGVLLFMAGIAAFTALGRNNFGQIVATKNKYFWMQTTFFACFCIAFLKQSYFENTKKQLVGLALILLLIIPVTYSTYVYEYDKIYKSKAKTITHLNTYNRLLTKDMHGVYHAANIQIIINNAVKDGYYKLPEFYTGRPVK